MEIISHRGYWTTPAEKNTETSFKRSFSMKVGTETDLRDHNTQLVISHDIADSGCMTLHSFFKNVYSNDVLLALNIKADGLTMKLKEALDLYSVDNYFVFDMSAVDMRHYIDNKLKVFGRLSEVERDLLWEDSLHGIWLDAFESIWYNGKTISDLLKRKRRICIVSSELHNREHIQQWEMLKPFKDDERLILCTDFPETALSYFGRTK
jgi:glycerophosphoryl diester phosphodiesterase